MNKMQTLHAFWSGFGLPAFDENTVPDEKDRIEMYGQAFPYLTYEATEDDFGNAVPQVVNLWYRSESWADVLDKEQEISDFITRGGRMVKYDDGAMWIQRARPWAQRLDEPNDKSVRRIVLNTIVEYMD